MTGDKNRLQLCTEFHHVILFRIASPIDIMHGYSGNGGAHPIAFSGLLLDPQGCLAVKAAALSWPLEFRILTLADWHQQNRKSSLQEKRRHTRVCRVINDTHSWIPLVERKFYGMRGVS
jgi:hypothetical protein